MTVRTLSARNGASPTMAPVSVTFPSLTRIFGDFFDDPFFGEAPALGQSLTLPLDLSEDDRNVIVRASLPGFSKEEIDVQVHDGLLSISAQRQEQREESNERYHRRERRMGSVSRQIALPTNVVPDQTHAELKDGVLTLRLPKTPDAQPKKIKIG